jgi:hypothetical protein
MQTPWFNPGTGSVSTVCASCGHGKEKPAPEDCRRPERHRGVAK